MKAIIAKAWKKLSLPKNIQLAAMRVTQDEFLIGVTGVILNDKNEILLCKHTYRGTTGWSLPGGYIKGGEHPKEGLAREIEEETGLIVRVTDQHNLRTDRETARIDISLSGYLQGGIFRESHEVSEAGFFKFEDLPILRQDQLVLINDVLNLKKTETRHVDYKNLSLKDRFRLLMKGGV